MKRRNFLQNGFMASMGALLGGSATADVQKGPPEPDPIEDTDSFKELGKLLAREYYSQCVRKQMPDFVFCKELTEARKQLAYSEGWVKENPRDHDGHVEWRKHQVRLYCLETEFGTDGEDGANTCTWRSP